MHLSDLVSARRRLRDHRRLHRLDRHTLTGCYVVTSVARAVPTLASTTHPIAAACSAPSVSCNTIHPITAATAGLVLITTPNVRGPTERSACSSRLKGIAADSIATANPVINAPGAISRVLPVAIPSGATVTVATTIAKARPSTPRKARPIRRFNRMYVAHPIAAVNANATPTQSRLFVTPPSRTTPTPARTTYPHSRAVRDNAAARPSGPNSSIVTAMPRGSRATDS